MRRTIRICESNNRQSEEGSMSKAKEAIFHLPDLRSKPCLRIFIESLLKQSDTAESDEQLFVPEGRW